MSAPNPAEWAEIAPHPGDHDLPAGRHELHRTRLLTAIAQQPRTRKRAFVSLRPTLAAAALVLVAAGIGGGLAARSGEEPPAALPSPETSSPAARQAPPGTAAKDRGYGTVRQLTDTADLVVRGEVASVADGWAVYRVEEVLYRAPGAPVPTEITVAADVPGRPTVLYLGLADPGTRAYRPLGGDFGIFDLAGETATSRSPAASVTGLRTDDATGAGHSFVTTLTELRQLARERR
ncbi:hypothetical protein EV382_2337 [Micromonospora violae]|uniref:Uncharacterized protein n=1 Tax=Micromonospora violae TaxID=1278207 RepID=A0A4V2FP50_9ACTN|nr:hypothetical protein [Micromonospora violae]RZT79140.1 hypothetical protein EV382_2337 [Micromonospora violae]